MARTTNKAESLLTFSRASSSTALTKVAYGPELVTNGDFSDGSTGWTLGTGWSVSGGAATHVGGTPQYLIWATGIELGKTYEMTVEVTAITGGSASLYIGGSPALLSITLPGTYTVVGIPPATNLGFAVRGNNTNPAYSVTVDNISVKEVFYNDPTGTVKLISHPTNKPRVEYDANGVAKGLLIEEARTNLVTNSLVFTSAPGAQGMTVTSSSETAPDGTTSASLCTATGTAIHRVRNSIIVTASGVTYSTSLFVKNVDADYIQIHNSGDLQYYANFDLVNGVVGTTGSKTTSTITAYPNGWYRITASYDGTGVMNAVSNIAIITSASAGFGENANKPGTQVHMWGFQREQGSFPTSYIPTSGATATRSVDLCEVPISKFGYNNVQGTLVVDFETPDFVDADVVDLGKSGNRYLIRNGLAFYGIPGSTEVAINYGASANNQRVAFAVQTNDAVAAVNGSIVGTDNTVTLFSDPTTLQIGALVSVPTNEKLNGHIKSIKYYPVRLDDDKLKELTL